MRDDQPPGALPAPVLDYLAQTAALVRARPESVARGERMFAEHGPEILMLLVLLFAALVVRGAEGRAGAASHGVPGEAAEPPAVRDRADDRRRDVARRPGPRRPGRAHGAESAADARRDPAPDPRRHRAPWPRGFGVPINQEDLLGTLMTFSWLDPRRPRSAGRRADAGRAAGVSGCVARRRRADGHRARSCCRARSPRRVTDGAHRAPPGCGVTGGPRDDGRAARHDADQRAARASDRARLPDSRVPAADVATFLGVPSHPFEEELIRLADRRCTRCSGSWTAKPSATPWCARSAFTCCAGWSGRDGRPAGALRDTRFAAGSLADRAGRQRRELLAEAYDRFHRHSPSTSSFLAGGLRGLPFDALASWSSSPSCLVFCRRRLHRQRPFDDLLEHLRRCRRPWRARCSATGRASCPTRISAKSAFGVLTLSGANSVMSIGPAQSSRCLISSQLLGAPPKPWVLTSTHDPFSL